MTRADPRGAENPQITSVARRPTFVSCAHCVVVRLSSMVDKHGVNAALVLTNPEPNDPIIVLVRFSVVPSSRGRNSSPGIRQIRQERWRKFTGSFS